VWRVSVLAVLAFHQGVLKDIQMNGTIGNSHGRTTEHASMLQLLRFRGRHNPVDDSIQRAAHLVVRQRGPKPEKGRIE